MKLFKGNRTRIFATLVGALGIVELYDDEIVRHMVPESYQGLLMMGIGVGIFVLRQITTTPPGAS